MYIRRVNKMKLTVPVYTVRAMAEQTALLDSGATKNFISHRTWEKLGIGKKALENPIVVYNVDGTRNKRGEVTHYCWLRVKHGGQEKLQQFFLTSLGGDRMILGYPFLREFNPPVNWVKGELPKGPVTLQSARYKYLKGAFRRAEKAMAHTGEMPDKLVAFLKRTNLAQEWSRIEERRRTHLTMETIPPEFRRHWKVFSEELSKRFPPARNPDMAIEFLPDAPTSIKCRPYPRSRKESEVEDRWVKEQVALKRLIKGPSPIVSPIFHIGKKDSDEKHIIMDYRRVNAVTKKDHNPIPSIRQAMEALHSKNLFSKFDIRWGLLR